MSLVFKFLAKAAILAVFAILFSESSVAQAKRPGRGKPAPQLARVTRIDINGLKPLLKPRGKPLLINFWATWCDPCREEFPELVRLDAAYKGKIDFITISLDDLAEIRTSVPKFLGEMKATMPAYLLRTADESAAVALVSKDWPGNLPMTILFAASGETAFLKNRKVSYDELASAIDKLLPQTRP